jgi:hypothetical protein
MWRIQHCEDVHGDWPSFGISCGGNEKQLWDLLTCLDKEHCQEVSDTPSKRGTKGRRELKNLECPLS